MKQDSGWKTRTFFLLFGIGAVTRCFPCFAQSGPQSKPNIILLVVDSLRADYLGHYGFPVHISPNIDAFAKNSISFDRCMSAAPRTYPSVCSLFTSMGPLTHGPARHSWIEDIKEVLPEYPVYSTDVVKQPLASHWYFSRPTALSPQFVTLAEVLKGAGYRTAAFSGGNSWLRPEHGLAQGFDVYENDWKQGCKRLKCFWSALPLFERAQAWMNEQRDPYFVYVHFMDVHFPYITDGGDHPALRSSDEDYKALKSNPAFGPSVKLPDDVWSRTIPRFRRDTFVNDMDEAADLRNWRVKYASVIRHFDRQFGQILEMLKASGTLDNAIIILTSDHGEELWEHRFWLHGSTLHAEEIHIPLIVSMPKDEKKSRTINEVVSSLDIMPTLLARVAPDVRLRMQGQDLGPYLRGERRFRGRNAALSSGLPTYPYRVSYQTTDHKIIFDVRENFPDTPDFREPGYSWPFPEGQNGWLFSNGKNLRDTRDLYNDLPRIRNSLEKKARDEAVRSLMDKKYSEPAAAFSPEEEEALRSLGYLQ